MQQKLFAQFATWLREVDLEIQWRKKVTIYDLCDSDEKIVKLYKEQKTAAEAAKELIDEVSSSSG